jgi:CMP-N-acetylneuraminic acid synthetase
MILAVIPARSGSKSVKDKNIRPLGGRPLMAWSIKAGLACKQIDQVVVSTDSDKYAQLAKFYGAEVIRRPAELAQDDTPMLPVLQQAVASVEKSGAIVSLVVLLDPTSPLRRIKDIDKCLELINLPQTDSVVTICEAEHNPFFVMGTVAKDYWRFLGQKRYTRRQDAPKAYRLNAAVYVIKKEVLMAGKIFTDNTRTVIMPPINSSHIDSELDFQYADWLIKEKHVQLDF